MGKVSLLIVVKDAEARIAYEEAIRAVGAAYDVAESFSEALRLSTENAYSGLLIDILTLIRSSKEEKLIAYDCINFYPSIRVKWDQRQKTMNLSPLEQSYSADTQTTLGYFIESRCKSFTARSLRRFPRKDINLNAILSTSCDFSEGENLKTFTVNISRGGTFVHTTRSFARGETVWICFHEMPDRPIQAVLRWQIEWGTSRSISGIGLSFLFQSQEQADGLYKMAKL